MQRPSNNFYTFGEKTHMYLNFEGDNIAEESYSNPYNPFFYLKEKLEEFIKHRKDFKCTSNEVYQVT